MWSFALELAGDDTPVFAQIASAITKEIRRGRLAPGGALPGSRTLANSLGVHRNTVLAAYDELVAQGWVRTEKGRGTFVAPELPVAAPLRLAEQRHGVPECPGYRLGPRPPGRLLRQVADTRHLIPLGRGIPDTRLVPRELLARAYRRTLRGGGGALLDYGDKLGHPRLRRALVEMLNQTRGLAATAEDLMITRGSQMALDLVARALIEPGDTVAVEAFGYGPAREAFARAGARVVSIPVDERGLCVEPLQTLLERGSLRALYLTPHHQYPTMAVLSPARRQALLRLARRHRFAIIEDDYDHEIHYSGRPVLPLASGDRSGNVVYVGSLSKILAPGLRLGYLVAPRELVDRLAEIRETVDGGGDPAIECAVAELLEDGEVQRHARRVRRIYRGRRDLLVELLSSHLASSLAFRVPAGGMALWARVEDADPDEPERWAERAAECGVFVSPGRWFSAEGKPAPYLRLGFAACNDDELRAGVAALVASRQSSTTRSCGRAGARGGDSRANVRS